MNGEVQLLGMVLSAMPVGEFDQRLVILTKDRGKLSAFARGSRKPNSPLLACSQPFTFGNFTLYEGRNSYNVKSGEIIRYFEEIQENWDVVCYASYLAEYADYYTRENVEAGEILKLLYVALQALVKGVLDKEMIRYIYELRMYACNGEAFNLFSCVKCAGVQSEENWKPMLHMRKGGLLCPECMEKCRKSEPAFEPPRLLGEGVLYAMRYIMTSPLEKLFAFTLKEPSMGEFVSIMEGYRKIYVQHNFRSLDNLLPVF